LIADKAVRCWGFHRELGDGTRIDHLTPVTVGEIAEASTISNLCKNPETVNAGNSIAFGYDDDLSRSFAPSKRR
jgi:hypothetical protein